jgi:hypothetical protein
MSNDPEIPRSIVDQIVDELLAELATGSGFDAQSIARLKKLAAQNALKKPAQVMQAIEPDTGGNNESP